MMEIKISGDVNPENQDDIVEICKTIVMLNYLRKKW
jgi:hypothetical protein